MQRMLAGKLSREGFDIGTSGDVAHAITELRRAPPDLIVLGEECVAGGTGERDLRAAAAGAAIPLIVISHRTPRNPQGEGVSLLQLPFRPRRLVELARAAL